MNIRQGLFGAIGAYIGCTVATAGAMGPMTSAQGIHPVFTLQGGYASINSGGNTQRFTGTDSDVFTYINAGGGKDSGFIGVFLGAEYDLSWFLRSGFFMQPGVEYNYFGKIGVNAITTETGSVNLTPGFSNQNQTQFSYSLGLGVDTQVNKKIRVGLGYRYSNFGLSSLGNGTVTYNNYQSPLPFALGNSNAYANQLIARISYVA